MCMLGMFASRRLFSITVIAAASAPRTCKCAVCSFQGCAAHLPPHLYFNKASTIDAQLAATKSAVEFSMEASVIWQQLTQVRLTRSCLRVAAVRCIVLCTAALACARVLTSNRRGARSMLLRFSPRRRTVLVRALT